MPKMSVEEAQSHLREVIDNLTPGEEIILTRGERPVAMIRAPSPPVREAPRFGTLKGTILHVAPDFDNIPEGFEEYLP